MTQTPKNPNLNGLAELAKRDGVDIRPTLLRVMTDLYVQQPEHTEREDAQYSELALRLIDLVDTGTRAMIAGKIAGYPNAPAAVRQRLLKDYIAYRPPAGAAQPTVTPFAGISVAANELNELFFAGNSEERRLILLNLPYAPITPVNPIPSATARETIHRLEAAALGHNVEVFAREIEKVLSISRAQARRLIDDPLGEPLVIVATAIGMPAAILQRVLLCLNASIGESVQRVYELAMLHEDIEPDAARQLVAIWQAARMQEAPQVSHAASPPPQRAVHPDDNARRPALEVARPKIRWDEHAQARRADGA